MRILVLTTLVFTLAACSDSVDSENNGGSAGAQGGSAGAQGGSAGAQGGSAGAGEDECKPPPPGEDLSSCIIGPNAKEYCKSMMLDQCTWVGGEWACIRWCGNKGNPHDTGFCPSGWKCSGASDDGCTLFCKPG